MRTVFIVNPKAGKGKGIEKFIESINVSASKLGVDVEIYITKTVGDGEVYAKTVCEECKASGKEVKLIACGGDGTVNEVLNGSIFYEKAAVGVVPIGTGNDFCRNFPDAGDFKNIEAQLKGQIIKSDAIRYFGLIDGKEQTRYCANMFNIGFDCNVVDVAARLKKYPFISGSIAYLLAVVAILIKKKGADLKVELDDKVYEDGPLLLTAIANGKFCGGGIKSAPFASVQDGQMDVNIIYNVTRGVFISKFPAYMKGTYPGMKNIEKIIFTKSCKTARITPRNGGMRLCTDGEIVDAGQVQFEVVENAFNLLVPAVI